MTSLDIWINAEEALLLGLLTDFSALGFSCCEIKVVSEGIAALLNEFVLNPFMWDLLVTLSWVNLAF